MRERIAREFDDAGAEQMVDAYVEGYAGANMSPEEIWVELICDSEANMNVFAGQGTTAEIAEKILQPVIRKAIADSKTEATRGPPAEGKYSREVDRKFQINFSGNVYSNRNVKLSNSAKAAIRSAIKSGNAHMAEDGSNGEVTAVGKVYLFDAFDSGDAHVYKVMSAEQLNIHDRTYGGANNGKTGRKGNKGASLNNGQPRNRVSDGAANIANSSSEYESNGKLAGSEPDGQRSRNASEGENTGEKYVSEDTYSPDYAHWRNTVKDSEPDARYSRELDNVKQLQRQNESLQKQVEYWKGQTKRTKEAALRQRDVNKLAKEITTEYTSKAPLVGLSRHSTQRFYLGKIGVQAAEI